MRKKLAAIAAAATLTLGATAVPAHAAPSIPNTSELSAAHPEIAQGLLLLISVPVMMSSFGSSLIGIPQCGLHDTRAC